MSRRRYSNHATRDHGGRGKFVFWIVLVAVVLGVWLAVIVVLGGNGGSGERGGSDNQEQAGSTSAQEQEASGGEGGSGGAGESRSSEGSGNGSGEARNVSDDDLLSERPGGGVPEGEVPIEDEEGRTNGQRGFVSSFVGAAYGYTGEDVEEYRSGAELRIDPATYYDSPGGESLRYYASLVEDGGAENAAVLKEYTILSGDAVEQQVAASELRGFVPQQLMQSEPPPNATVSEVVYAVGNRYGDPEGNPDEDFGQVYGEVEYLKQRLFIARTGDGEGWKILAASAPKPTEDPDAGERPPGAPKVMDPQGPGTGGGHDH